MPNGEVSEACKLRALMRLMKGQSYQDCRLADLKEQPNFEFERLGESTIRALSAGIQRGEPFWFCTPSAERPARRQIRSLNDHERAFVLKQVEENNGIYTHELQSDFDAKFGYPPPRSSIDDFLRNAEISSRSPRT